MNIVFAHHGTSLPRYLYLNLKRTAEIFPEHKVWLVTDSVLPSQSPRGVGIIQSRPNLITEEISRRLSHPKDFRSNFWLHAITRFVSLHQAILEIKSPILHIESDILLSHDFPLSIFSKIQKGIAFPVVSRERGVASTVYFADEKSAQLLVELSLETVHFDSKTSDMLILRKFYETYPELTTVLPIAPAQCIDYKAGIENDLLTKINSSAELFGGIIDGHDLGVYFFGTDPRNSRGRITFNREVELNLIHTSRWRLEYDDKRKFVNVIDSRGVTTKIFSLHLTSKNPQAFQEKTLPRYFKRVIEKSRSKERNEWVISVLMVQAWSAFRRRFLPK